MGLEAIFDTSLLYQDKHAIMKKRELVSRMKNMLKDREDGYYGMEEIIDEIWSYILIERRDVAKQAEDVMRDFYVGNISVAQALRRISNLK